MRTIASLSFCLFLVFFSCKKEGNTTEAIKDTLNQQDTAAAKEALKKDAKAFAPQSTDEQTANNIINFLVNDFLKDEISALKPEDRKFQFYKIDLNDDGKEEIFIRLKSSYFCGSGGCTFLLLNKYGEMITKFTVTRAPIFAEPTKVNGWSLLLVKDAGVFKELRFKEGTYPSNPSLLPKAPYDAPSGHAQVLFGDGIYDCKTFEF
jgi:hypothetical protein